MTSFQWFPTITGCLPTDENSHRMITLLLMVGFSMAIAAKSQVSYQAYWHSALEVSEYHDYSSIQLFDYDIPTQTVSAVWYFTGLQTPESCPSRYIDIYLQHGSFPVIAPHNESFPDNFSLRRSNFYHLRVLSDKSKSLRFFIHNPKPGTWFAAVFLADKDDRIKQKGLHTKCGYAFFATQDTNRLEGIQELVRGLPYQDQLLPPTMPRTIYRYHLPDTAWKYTIKLLGCQVSVTESNTLKDMPCPLELRTQGDSLPSLRVYSQQVNCSNHHTHTCLLTVTSPELGGWHYLAVDAYGQDTVHYEVHLEVFECSTDQGTVYTNVTSDDTNSTDAELNFDSDVERPTFVPHHTQSGTHACSILPELGRYARIARDFSVHFSLHSHRIILRNALPVGDKEPLVMYFYLKPLVDLGGTLHFELALGSDVWNVQNRSLRIVVDVCLQHRSIPVNDSGISCSTGDRMLQLTPGGKDRGIVFVPYPQPGKWFIGIKARCLIPDSKNNSVLVETSCEENIIPAEFYIGTFPCVDGECNAHGECRQFISSVFRFSTCSCQSGWRGYGCTDGQGAAEDAELLTGRLLLTLSNLLFLPAVIVAFYRRLFVEALVYFYTMFFSTFYHACDGAHKYSLCIMHYNVLSYCDFYGSIMSFWVTLIAMAKLREPLRSLAYMIAALCLALGVEYDRHGLWVFVVPVMIGITVMAISWCRQCYKRHSCYPNKKRWLFFLFPGVLLAGTGLVIYTFVETTENYKFVHSVWHSVMALSILLLLPSRTKAKIFSRSQSYIGEELNLDPHSLDDQPTYSLLQPATFNQAEDMGTNLVI